MPLSAPASKRLLAAIDTSARCKVCGARAIAFDVVDFNKVCSLDDCYHFGLSGVPVYYYRCHLCGLIFTEYFDKWEPEDFSSAIYNADYIKVDGDYESVRPVSFANEMAARWGNCWDAHILDYGSGNGAFANQLRLHAYQHVQTYDPYTNPTLPDGTFDIITCFEVIEHERYPLDVLRKMSAYLKDDGCIIFSQTLQPPDIDKQRGNWWYLGPRNGHICTFTQDTLAHMAQQCGLTFHLGEGLYAFSRAAVSEYAGRALATVGRPHYFKLLMAPADDPNDPCWHPVEEVRDGCFRWSRSSRLRWPAPPMPHRPATLRVVLPLLDSVISTGTACAKLGSQTSAFTGERLLTADFEIDDGLGEYVLGDIEVLTAEPVSPLELGRSDDFRKLGMAVLTTAVG